MTTTNKLATTALAVLAVLLILPMTGCFYAGQALSKTPGGNMYSDDSYTYISTPYEPLTVTLYDNRDNEPIWTVDVPIGSKVSLRFRKNKVKEGTARRPDIMEWVIYDQKKRTARYENTMAVPSPESRMMRVSLRNGPEFPEEAPEEQIFPNPDHEWLPVEPKEYRTGANNNPSTSYSGN
jgi:hypothetical protein